MPKYQISEAEAGYQVADSSGSYQVAETDPEALDDFITAMNAVMTSKITGIDSTFEGVGNWETGLGGLTADISTVPGAMYLDFTAGNQAVKLADTVDTENYFLIRIKAYKVSGAGMTIRIGKFVSGTRQESQLDIVPISGSRWYYGYLWDFSDAILYIGALTANNNGTKIAIEEIHCEQVSTTQILSVDYDLLPTEYFSGLFNDVKRSNQTLLKAAVIGDSIMANSYGGALPSDEGDTLRPPRITTNNVPRRFYDRLKYNTPLFRRLDHADWTRSTLGGGDDFEEILLSTSGDHRTPWHPNNTDEKYFRSGESGAYCEIIIPDGQENCAVLYRTGYQSDGANMDDEIDVTLNGGDISAYGDAVLDEYTGAITGFENAYGFGLNVAEYSGLPSGANTIRLTKSTNSDEFHLWGVLYWSGDTMIILNTAYGGGNIKSLSDITGQATDKNSYELAFTQMPIMNNSGSAVPFEDQLSYLCITMNRTGIPIENTLFYGTHPFGIDPVDDDPNYYTLYADPDFKDGMELAMKIIGFFELNFIDVFRYFETDIIAQGGTLIGGEAGYYYTSDGQHPDDDGADYYDGFLVDKLPQIPA